MTHRTYYQSEIGLIELTASERGLQTLYFVEEKREAETSSGHLAVAVQQLDEYFQGRRQQFDLTYDLQGTEFQRQVWQTLLTIPYGQTISYLDLSRAIGNEKAIRAVGQANGRNPISIMVPCHRVIGHNGKLTGYGGGLWRKKWLLQHEQTDLPILSHESRQ